MPLKFYLCPSNVRFKFSHFLTPFYFATHSNSHVARHSMPLNF
ncbi:hypothetical protein CAMGR0001_0319 [Campylobacter gracilis RM3268]|uniref:Uncharacterized protein n=1 Tax=Campylobacter gracilis RM3268 TaxID=553220 RepID=C8PKU6_9BACT|nr:hypothetical protein CAMGR0001_0319 [Campylobacter gracilis RM3268]